jgi:type IV secretion system protein VirB8
MPGTMDEDQTGSDDAARQAYYAEARSWAADRQAEQLRSRRTAWIVAAVAAGIAVIEALALIALASLKTVVPYTLLVDRNTGFVQALEGTHPATLKPQAALTQSLLAQYIVARETFDIGSLPDQYRKVALWSADAARRDYLAVMPAGNPESPLSRYPRSAVVETHIESVSTLGPDTALVRFYTERHDQNQGAAPRAYWAAMLRYRYSGEPMAIEDRLVNPLGFQVVHYRRDQEAPPAPEIVATAPARVAPLSRLAPGSPDPHSTSAWQPARLSTQLAPSATQQRERE